MYVVPFKERFLYTSSNDTLLFYYNFVKVRTFAGRDECSSRDGTVLYSWFYTSNGRAVEFDNAFYVSDSSAGSIKFITPLKQTAKFLDALYNHFLNMRSMLFMTLKQ